MSNGIIGVVNIKVQHVISTLLSRNVIPAEPSSYKKLSGGTVSELYLLHVKDSKFVLKFNEPDVTGPEALFLNTYGMQRVLPKLLFVDPSQTYMVYSFMNGSTGHEGSSKKEVLKRLVEELINNYVKVAADPGWGWLDSPSSSWQAFLRNETSAARRGIGSLLGEDDHRLIADLVEKLEPTGGSYLLHGDCGYHNFIFDEKKLTGVIDPAPVIGVPLYDLVYAFFSEPEDLTKETFDYALHWLKEKPAEIYGQVLVGLYLRMALCNRHHPEDLPAYMKAWSEWVASTGNPKED